MHHGYPSRIRLKHCRHQARQSGNPTSLSRQLPESTESRSSLPGGRYVCRSKKQSLHLFGRERYAEYRPCHQESVPLPPTRTSPRQSSSRSSSYSVIFYCFIIICSTISPHSRPPISEQGKRESAHRGNYSGMAPNSAPDHSRYSLYPMPPTYCWVIL